jgi:glycosyltransferase involved in cell wall biosynthesis
VSPDPGDERAAVPVVLVLATAEWGAPIATNQHYLTRELSAEFPIAYLEGTGTRAPRLTRTDLRRMWRRVRGGTRQSSTRPVPDGVLLRRAVFVPSQSWPARVINGIIAARIVRRTIPARRPYILWTFTPYTIGLERRAAAVVYHLVDLIHENSGVDRRRFIAAEGNLTKRCSLAVATSEAIAGHLRHVGFRRVSTRPNVADTKVFEEAARTAEQPAEAGVVFVGAITPAKVDLPLLLEVALSLSDPASLELIGPVDQGLLNDPTWRALRDMGVRITGPLEHHDVATRLARSRVGLIPYQLNDLTAGVSPLKTFEYLAAGLAIVSVPLPEIRPVRDMIWVESSVSSFVTRVQRLLLEVPSPGTRADRQSFARANDWSTRGVEYRSVVTDLARGRGLTSRRSG